MKEKFWNLANIASLSRVFFAVIFIILLFYSNMVVAFIIFIIAALTDLIDGKLARLLKQDSRIGAFLDPLCDRVLIISAVIALVIKLSLPLWELSIFLRDFFVIIGAVVILFSGKKIKFNFKANMINKFVTFLQVLAIMSIMILPGYQGIFILVIVLFSIFAVFSYTGRFFGYLKA